jgi:outer membrane immunogenic protein
MKNLLIAAALVACAAVGEAGAADLPVSVPPAPVWNWTGFYIGAQGGAGWGTTGLNQTSNQICDLFGCSLVYSPAANTATASYGLNSWHGGGTAGFNWQSGPVVFGLEGDLSAANISGLGDCTYATNLPAAAPPMQTGCRTNMPWFGTVTGRAGVAVDHALVYVKAGGARAQFDHTITAEVPASVCCGEVPQVATLDDKRVGGTVGIGIEYKFWRYWSAKIEYD